MSERLKWQGNEYVGSKSYFEKINKDTLLGELLRRTEEIKKRGEIKWDLDLIKLQRNLKYNLGEKKTHVLTPLEEISTSKKRSLAVMVDFLIANSSFLISITLIMLSPFIGKHPQDSVVVFTTIVFVTTTFIGYIHFIFFRDIWGRSIGKNAYHLKIISTIGDEKPTRKQLLLRNIIYIPFYDFYMNGKYGVRFGDKIAKTKVVAEVFHVPETTELEDGDEDT